MEELSIAEIQTRMAAGELTALELADSYLRRIEALDQSGPALNSLIELNPDVLEIAQALDKERQSGFLRGPLHGIPIVLKDNIDTHDKMTTTAGSLALQGAIAPRDAFLVERLRAEGAILIAKANLSEWANFRSSRSSSGWSSRGGQTHNPYALDRSPCGSSSGSAVAVAANLCSAAIGTETDGSITCPAHVNGIVGIKPTLGFVSRSGVIPIAHSQDTAGPMARCVADAAILLSALSGIDARDPATQASADHLNIVYTQYLEPNGLAGARIGVLRQYFGSNPFVDALCEHAIQVIKDLGAEIIDPAEIETDGKWSLTELDVLLYEFKADLNAYLSTLPPDAPVRSMKQIIEFNQQNQARVMPYFGQERMLAAQEKGALTQKRYQNALEKNHRLTRSEGIDLTMQKYQLDALIAPTGGPAWLIDYVNGDHYSGPNTTSAPAVAGYPHITVPAGNVLGLPVGLSFIAGPWQEAKLIRYAYAFEQATHLRIPPVFPASLNLPAFPSTSGQSGSKIN